MYKSLFIFVATCSIAAGSVFAQNAPSDTSISTTSTTTTNLPTPDSFKSSKTQKIIDNNGNETDKSQTYSSGSGASHATSSSRTTGVDGSQHSTSVDERTIGGETTTTSKTTTTTTTDH